MKLYVQFKNGRPIPEYSSDYDKFGKIKPDTTYLIEITKPRNINRHRMFFALLNMVFDNQDKYNNLDDLREQLTINAGYFRTVETLDGKTEKRANSISFAKMDDIEFQEYYKSVWDVVARWLDLSNEDIQREIINFM